MNQSTVVARPRLTWWPLVALVGAMALLVVAGIWQHRSHQDRQLQRLQLAMQISDGLPSSLIPLGPLTEKERGLLVELRLWQSLADSSESICPEYWDLRERMILEAALHGSGFLQPGQTLASLDWTDGTRQYAITTHARRQATVLRLNLVTSLHRGF